MADLMPGHQQALDELSRIAAARKGTVLVEKVADHPRSGWLEVEISIDCADTPTGSGGVELGRRESVSLDIPRDFPFSYPAARVRHNRFAGLPHVLWRRYICLYQSDNEWDPADGMFGFTDRLSTWYLRAAEGTLQEVGQPLHPPVTYSSGRTGFVIISADLPPMDEDHPWFGAAIVVQRDESRADVIGWVDFKDSVSDALEFARSLNRRLESVSKGERAPACLGPVIVLPRPLSFEFPFTALELITALKTQGIRPGFFLKLLDAVSSVNAVLAKSAEGQENSSFYTFIGAPMRGRSGDAERLTHLAVWRLSGAERSLTSALISLIDAEDVNSDASRQRVSKAVREWIRSASLSWEIVYEQRPQIVVRRDTGRPVEWLNDRRVLVLGCGALGAPIAEQCLRGGVAEIIVADRSWVSPGLLVRQPYEDADIGKPKANALAVRLKRIRPDAHVTPIVGDLMETVLEHEDKLTEVDLLIDATANRTVSARLERLRWTRPGPWPSILTVGVGHHCERGVAALAFPAASGGGTDIMHRLAGTVFADSSLADVADDFFPVPGTQEIFQPEPGCSEPTFTGSASEATALSAYLFSWALSALNDHATGRQCAPMSARIVRMAASRGDGGTPRGEYFWWPNDVIVKDHDNGYQIRFSQTALDEMRSEALTTAELEGSLIETGGILLGWFDDACRVVWITAAEGPSPDSLRAAHFFLHGIEGVEECIENHAKESGGRIRFVGMWHTHPCTQARPSNIDEKAMKTLLVPVQRTPPRALLVIIGGRPDGWNSWLHGVGTPDIFVRIVNQTSFQNQRKAIPLPSRGKSATPSQLSHATRLHTYHMS